MTERQADRWSALVVFAWALVAFWATHPRAVGLFSDDGIYLTSARALAERGEYRLASVPGEPFQTKYPPGWPAVLAIVWRLAPQPAIAARVAQGLAVALTALSWWLFRRVATRRLGLSARTSLALVVLPVASPMLFVGANWPLSEPLFGCLAAWALLWSRTGPGEQATAWDSTRSGLIAAGAFLTRIQGVALIAALVASRVRERRWRHAALAGAPGALAAAGWLAWTGAHSVTLSPLLSYYSSYRHSGMQWETPGAGRIVGSFLLELGRSVEHFGALILGMRGSGAWLLGGLLVGLACLGAVRLWAEERRESLLWLGFGLCVVALHPDPAARFLTPMLPLLIGVAARAELPWRAARAGRRGVVLAVAAGGALRIGVELAARDPALLPDPLTLSSQQSELATFDSTARFLRQHVAPGEAIAVANDLWFHLATDRPTLRFWLYRPRELARSRHGAALPRFGEPQAILAELDRLGVRWLVLEPGSVDRFIEGPAILRLGRELVAAPEARARLRFATPGNAQEVYELGSVAGASAATAAAPGELRVTAPWQVPSHPWPALPRPGGPAVPAPAAP